MKRFVFLIFPAFLLLIHVACFSQNNKFDDSHADLLQKKTTKNTAQKGKSKKTFIQIKKTGSIEQQTDLLYEKIAGFLTQLKIDSALYYVERLKQFADSAAYEPALGKYYLARGSALFYRGKNEESSTHVEKAINLFTRYNNQLYLGLSYRLMARNLAGTGKFNISRQYYHNALSLFATAKKEELMQGTYYDLGRNYYLTYEVDSAAYYLITALTLAEKLSNREKSFLSAKLLGSMYLTSGNLVNAGKYLKYAIDIHTPAITNVQLRFAWADYSNFLVLSGDYAKAEEAILEFGKLNKMLGDAWGVNQEKKLKGILSYYRGNYAEALNYLRQAYNPKEEIKFFKDDMKNISFLLGKTELKTGDIDSAITHLHLARSLSKDIQFSLDEMESNLLLSEAFQLKRNTDSAYHYFRLYSFAKDSIMTIKKEKVVLELGTKYETEKKQQQIKQLQNEKLLYTFQLLLKNKELEEQDLLDIKKSQQLSLLTQENEIQNLQAAQRVLAFESQEKEIVKKQNEFELVKKQQQLQAALAEKQNQQRNIALIVIAAILLLGVYGYFRYRQNKTLSKKLAASLVDLKAAQQQLIKSEKEKEAENVRLRISRDIHDEVGATLSGVALFSEIAKQKMDLHMQNDVREYLNHISANSKEMVEKMSDIIWTINPKNDSFERIIFKLQSYAMNLCAGKEIQLHYQVDENVKQFSPDMQVRKNIYLILKEAINNAVKYSGGHNIYFSILREKDEVKIELSDDGKGFEKNNLTTGDGISNMEARASELNASFSIQSLPGAGTTVRLQFNFHPIGGQLVDA